MTTKISTTNIQDTALTTLLGPKIASIVYPGTETATDTNGGETINLTGTGFQSGCNVLVNGQSAGTVTFISSTQISFTAPASSAGTYVIYVINPDGGTAISIPGISYSGTPTWTTTAGSVGSVYETASISTTLTATGDAPITYTLASGTLPTGSTLNSSTGLLSGTAPATASTTTYNFTITAKDAQNQTTNRAFSITLNPDTVTWSSPTSNQTYSVYKDQVMANVTMSATSAAGGSITYTADTLPAGLSITGANIAGTPTVAANTSTTLTATSTTTRTATRTINWVVSVANDTYWKNTTLLLNGETTNTSFISDGSTNSFGLTISGDTKPVLFNPYQGDGYYSAYFNGSSYVDVTGTPVPLSGQFTIEAWIYTTASATQIMYSQYLASNGNRFHFSIDSNTGYKLGFAHGTAATVWGATVVPLNQWNHVAVTRDSSNTLRLFLNGVVDGSQTSYTSSLYQGGTRIGYFNNTGSVYFNGYMSNMRVISGTAQYTSAFTPSTSPLTAISGTSFLGFQSNRFIDNSTNSYTLTLTGSPTISPAIPFTANSSYSTYGSTYFDGSGDYLTAAQNTAFNLGTGAFTVECWVFFNSFNSNDRLIGLGDGAMGGTTYTGWTLELQGSGTTIGWYRYDGTETYLSSSYTFQRGQWYHIAVSRNGSSNLGVFVNGTRVYNSPSASLSYNNVNSNPLYIGAINDGASPSGWKYLNGYISNARVVNGSAVYDPTQSTLTVPTSPLTAITNTSLLTLQYNGGANNSGIIDNSPFNNIITRNGNSSQGSFSPYSQTGWSTYFNGSSDYLTLPSSSTAYNFGTGVDFTIEAWVYPTLLAGNSWGIIDARVNGATSAAWILQLVPSAGTYRLEFFNAGANDGTTSIPLNTWTHVAVSRVGTNLRFYVNGTLDTTITSYGGSISPGTTAPRVGTTKDASGTAYATTGYISNLRIVNGTGLYSSNFTPSTTPLTPITNTSLLTCQSNRFIDNSPNNFTLTTSGTPSIQAFSPFGSISEATPISYSNYFDGSGDYLTTTFTGGLGSSDFTVEYWVYHTSFYNYITNISTYRGSTGWSCGTQASAQIVWYSSGAEKVRGTTAMAANTWNHIAFVRSGGTLKGYLNGVQDGTTSTETTTFSNTDMHIGRLQGGSPGEYTTGYISNMRIVVGTAVYTTNFTPPTTPLTAIANTSLLTCQSTRMIDNSTNAFTITANGDTKPKQFNPFGYTAQTYTSYTPSIHGGSCYFDGTTDYVTSPASASNIPSGDFTVEIWAYPTSIPAQVGLVGINNTTSSGAGNFGLYIETSRQVTIFISGNTTTYSTASAVITIGAWNHVAVVRSGSTNTIYVNGVSVYTNTASPGWGGTPVITVGRLFGDNTGVCFYGYLSDARVTKAAVYTSNFVPPTSPLTSYSTTIPSTLLLNMNNGGIVDQHGSVVLETVGNAQVSTSVKKYNNGSIYFDGSGDYLYGAPNVNYAMGSGDFTLELWYYPITHTNTDPSLMGNYNVTWTTNKWAFHAPHATYANKYSFWVNNYSTNSAILVSTSNVTDGSWVHIAISRSGSTWKMFINGTAEATTTSSVALDAGTAASMDGLYVGANFYTGGGGRYINAYIDDLRFTKGYARYTANFTAPTSALITK